MPSNPSSNDSTSDSKQQDNAEPSPANQSQGIRSLGIRNAVVLVADRFGAGQISAYGNTCFQTENLNRLVTKGLMFEQTIAPTTKLSDAYQMFLGGDWIDQASAVGVATSFLTDDKSLADHPSLDKFDEVLTTDHPNSGKGKSAASIADTQMAQFFAQAIDWLLSQDESTESGSSKGNGSIKWLHCRGLEGDWDAPYQMREILADEDDPEPPSFVEPPSFRFDLAKQDPDQLLGLRQACEPQVAMLDDFIGVLSERMSEARFANTLFCFLSPRGYPLGEHGVVGSPATEEGDGVLKWNGQCFNEANHVPMILCFPQTDEFQTMRLVRSHSIVQAHQLLPVIGHFVQRQDEQLHALLDEYVFSLPNRNHELAVSINDHEAAIQTHAWKLVAKLNEEKTSIVQSQLFVKPDDRWEVNDVSRRCPQIVEQMGDILLEKLRNPDDVIELPEDLTQR